MQYLSAPFWEVCPCTIWDFMLLEPMSALKRVKIILINNKVCFHSFIEERAARLARIDGVECFGILVGVLASPLIFNRFGYFGSFGISVAFTFTGLLYLIVFIK